MKVLKILLALVLFLNLISCSSDTAKTRVVLIGIDGAGWETIDYQITKGNLPFFKKLKEEGAWTWLKTTKPTISPLIWTSIATGKNYSKHGIFDFVTRNKKNQQVPVDGLTKRASSIWNILDEFGKKTITINWWVTSPPVKLNNGIMISDNLRRLIIIEDENKRNKLKPTIHPEKYFNTLSQYAKTDYSRIIKENGLPDFLSRFEKIYPRRNAKTVPVLKLYRPLVMQDIFIEKISSHLYRKEEFDFFATYIRMPDITQHFCLKFIDNAVKAEFFTKLREKTATKEDRTRFWQEISDILLPIYQYSEKFLKTFMEQPKYKDAYFIIVSDHSFNLSRKGYHHTGIPKEEEAPAGIFIARGPKVKKGYFEKANVYDIVPTLLYLYDLPVGQDMDGKPLTGIFDFNRRIRYKKYKSQYRLKRGKRDKELDKKTLEELKSLGYID